MMCKLVRIKTNRNKYVRVAAHKKDCIKGIIRIAGDCDYIEQIIVFGSSVENRCRKTSDIDLAIVSNIPGSRLYRSASYRQFKRQLYALSDTQMYDVLQFYSRAAIEKSKDQVCRDIISKGIVVYERNKDGL